MKLTLLFAMGTLAVLWLTEIGEELNNVTPERLPNVGRLIIRSMGYLAVGLFLVTFYCLLYART